MFFASIGLDTARRTDLFVGGLETVNKKQSGATEVNVQTF
jgi:hypothetical protein